MTAPPSWVQNILLSPLLPMQNDYYRGYYPANYTTINGSPSPALGSPGCSWCVNGTSPNGWYDVLAAGAAGVVYASPSTSDAVRPQARAAETCCVLNV